MIKLADPDTLWPKLSEAITSEALEDVRIVSFDKLDVEAAGYTFSFECTVDDDWFLTHVNEVPLEPRTEVEHDELASVLDGLAEAGD